MTVPPVVAPLRLPAPASAGPRAPGVVLEPFRRIVEGFAHVGRRSGHGSPGGRSLRSPDEWERPGGADEGVWAMWGVRRALVVVLVAAAVLAGAPAGAGPLATSSEATTRPAALGRLSISAIGVDAGIIPVGVTRAGHLAIGRSVRDVYRWRSGVLPGQPGSAVLAGHTWSKGPGVFDKLGRLRPGNLVVVGRNRFEVTRVRRVTGMSRSAVAGLFSDRGKPRLVLITCGDRNDLTGDYRTRIIVNARLLPSR